MTKKDQIIKMSITAVIAFLIVIFLTIPSLSEILGYYFCDDVEDIHSQVIKEDKIVKVRFDSVISVFDIKSMYYMKYFSENYYLLRIGKDQYIYVHIPTADIDFWKGVTLYKNPSEAAEFSGEKKYALIGRVRKFSEEEKEKLLESVNSQALQDYARIINDEMTNLDFYVDVTYVKRELIFVAIEIVVLFVLAMIFLKALKRYKEIQMEDDFYDAE